MVDLKDLLETAYYALEQRIKEGEHVTGQQLAAAMRANREEKVPDVLFEYLCRFLEGKIRKKPGPTRKSGLVEAFKPIHAQIVYRKYLEEEKSKQKRENGSKQGARTGMPPHEIAAKRVQAEFLPSC